MILTAISIRFEPYHLSVFSKAVRRGPIVGLARSSARKVAMVSMFSCLASWLMCCISLRTPLM